MILTSCQVIYTEKLLPSYITPGRKPLRNPCCLYCPAVHPTAKARLISSLAGLYLLGGFKFSLFSLLRGWWDTYGTLPTGLRAFPVSQSCSQLFEPMQWCPVCLNKRHPGFPDQQICFLSLNLTFPKAAGPRKWASFLAGRELCSVRVSPAHNCFERGLPHHRGCRALFSLNFSYLSTETDVQQRKNQR